MFRIGQEVCTKYGVGEVVCVGSNKPQVYVRVHSRPNCLYVFSFAEISEIEAANFAPPSPREQAQECSPLTARSASGEFGQQEGDAW